MSFLRDTVNNFTGSKKNRPGKKDKKNHRRKKEEPGGGNGEERTLIKEENVKVYTKEDLLTPIQQFRDLANNSKDEKTLLMIKKLELCCVIIVFTDNNAKA